MEGPTLLLTGKARSLEAEPVDATVSGRSTGVVKQHIVRVIYKRCSSRLISPWCSEKTSEALWGDQCLNHAKTFFFNDYSMQFMCNT